LKDISAQPEEGPCKSAYSECDEDVLLRVLDNLIEVVNVKFVDICWWWSNDSRDFALDANLLFDTRRRRQFMYRSLVSVQMEYSQSSQALQVATLVIMDGKAFLVKPLESWRR